MKYIRTKDELGILIEPTDNEELQKLKVGVNDMIFSTWYGDNRDNIIKQADTIEELCDGFIFKDTHANELHFLDSNSGISLLGASLFEETLRGFIETDKGLIYVAKMNDKGELELI